MRPGSFPRAPLNAPESPAAPRRRTSALAWLLLLVALPLAAALGWRAWQSERDARRAADAEDTVQIEALQQRVATLRQGQQAQGKRLQQAEATNRLLRDELLAMGQRAALLEDSVQRLADPAQDAARALRLDEVELLLAQGRQRLLLAGDLQGARSAYALAARLLDALDAPADIDLRQVLADERAMLDALGADPRVAAVARLDAFEAGLDAAAGAPASATATAAPERDAAASAQPWWQRVASRIVDVRRSDQVLVVDAGERAAGLAALRLELSLARTAAERRDSASYAAALARVRALVPRLWPRSAARDARLRDLDAIAALPLAVELPTLGTTLDQLRLQRGRRADARAPM